MGFFAKMLGREPAPTAAELQAQGARVIDVRTRAEYRSGHVAGARNIDVDSPSFASSVKGLQAGRTYVVYCHSGARANHAVSLMAGQGLTVVNGGSLNSMVKNGWQLGA